MYLFTRQWKSLIVPALYPLDNTKNSRKDFLLRPPLSFPPSLYWHASLISLEDLIQYHFWLYYFSAWNCSVASTNVYKSGLKRAYHIYSFSCSRPFILQIFILLVPLNTIYPSGWPRSWIPLALTSRVPQIINLCCQAQLAYLFVYLFTYNIIVCSSSASSHLPRLSFSKLTCEAYSNFSMKVLMSFKHMPHILLSEHLGCWIKLFDTFLIFPTLHSPTYQPIPWSKIKVKSWAAAK